MTRALLAVVAVALLVALRPRRHTAPMIVWASTADDEELVPMSAWRASYDHN